MTSRNQAIWGETGQKLINDAKILITGLSITGIEAIKTAAMLGIGTIYLVGDEQGSGFFLEQAMNPAKKQGKQLEKIVNDLRFKSGDLNTTVNVEAVEESYLNNDRLIKQLNPDAIFDFTQDLSSQLQSIEYGIQLSAEKPVEVFLGGCNAQDFTLTHYSPSENDDAEDIADEKEIDRYEGKDQDVTTSHILSSIAIEFFRKRLFNRHKEIISASQKDIKKPHKERGPFRDTLKYSIKHPQASQNIKQQHTNCLRTSMTQEDFSIGCHDAAENLITTLNLDDLPNINTSLEGKTFLVCGCGAIGNPVADMLVRKGAAKIDFMDFDKIKLHNAERQPFYCNRAKEYKAEVLSEKIKKIAEQMGNSIKSTAYIGKVCEKIEQGQEKQAFDQAWFSKNRYDIILGCFDSAIARDTLNDYAAKIGFTYADAGSSTISSKATVFVPGETACLDCTANIKFSAEDEKEDKEYWEQQTCGNPQAITPNVNMSNRIAAALMVSEATQYLNSESENQFSGKITYFNEGTSFKVIITEPECDLCKNDDTDKQ